MKIDEILNDKSKQLNEFALENDTGYSDELVMGVLQAQGGQWSEEMTADQILEKVGVKK
ncbi:hypothetical protein RsoM2USA_115 [Ralstonia phage RsoM2USA]|nr:hypothetical protein RsoM2USA_115 [Ralstonia phage RsoM2USA]